MSTALAEVMGAEFGWLSPFLVPLFRPLALFVTDVALDLKEQEVERLLEATRQEGGLEEGRGSAALPRLDASPQQLQQAETYGPAMRRGLQKVSRQMMLSCRRRCATGDVGERRETVMWVGGAWLVRDVCLWLSQVT